MAMLLFHGWATNKHIFDRLIPQIKSEVLAVDLPGHGSLSESYPSSEDYLSDIASGIKEPMDVLGWSLGGLYALKFAANYPQLVKSLILVATFPRYSPTEDYTVGQASTFLKNILKFFNQDFNYYLKQFLIFQCLNNEEEKKAVVKEILPRLIERYNLNLLAQSLKDSLNEDLRSLLPKLLMPVLLLYGSKDRITPPAFGQFFKESLVNSKLVIMQESAHIPLFSEREEFIQLVNDFLTQEGK